VLGVEDDGVETGLSDQLHDLRRSDDGKGGQHGRPMTEALREGRARSHACRI
jgi:hypothetical protein